MRSASSEQNSIRSSASSVAARAASRSPSRAASSTWSEPSRPRYCGSRESTASSAARARCRRAASRSSRASVSSAWRRLTSSSQLPPRGGRIATSASAASASSQAPVSKLSTAIRSRSQSRSVGRPSSSARPLRATSSASWLRPTRCSESRQVDRRHRDVLHEARVAGQRERAAQRLGPLVDVPERGERDAERVERADLVGERVARAVELLVLVERPAGGGDGLAVARLQHQRLGLAGQQARALGARIVVGEQREAVLELLERLLLAQQRPQRAVQPAGQACRASRGRRLVDERERPPRQRDGAGVLVGVQVADGGLLDQLELVRAGERGGVGHARPQLERALEERRALAVGLDVHRRPAGAHRGGQRGRLVPGREVMVRDRGCALRAGRRAGLARLREPPVQVGALAGQQVVVHGLAQQRVAERVAIAVGHDDVSGHRLAQGVAQRARLQLRDGLEHRRARAARWPTARA